MISDQSRGFIQSGSDWSLCTCHLAHAQIAEHIVVLASCLPVIKPHDIVQKRMEGTDGQK